MRRFKVDWLQNALDDLADAWSNAENRDAVNLAVEAIDDKLAENPTEFSDRMIEKLYFFSEPPLRVAFTVDEVSRMVRIVGLGTLPPGPLGQAASE
ncbi:MAG TPA: hypothetical protein VMV10_14340 [Pirellulales bacterium]|nr:hypothetical protein [Pirellulales bacterium]